MQLFFNLGQAEILPQAETAFFNIDAVFVFKPNQIVDATPQVGAALGDLVTLYGIVNLARVVNPYKLWQNYIKMFVQSLPDDFFLFLVIAVPVNHFMHKTHTAPTHAVAKDGGAFAYAWCGQRFGNSHVWYL